MVTYLCDTVQDNWRRGGEEAQSSRVGVVWDVLSPGSPCRLVAGWERGVRKRQGHWIEAHDQSRGQENGGCSATVE